MVTVAAAAIAGAAWQAIKQTPRVVVVVEYPIIELHIRVAINGEQMMNILSIKEACMVYEVCHLNWLAGSICNDILRTITFAQDISVVSTFKSKHSADDILLIHHVN